MTPQIFDDWHAVLDSGSAKAALRLTLEATPDGIAARLQERRAGEMSARVVIRGEHITLNVPAADIAMDLTLAQDRDQLVGVWRNSGVAFPAAFTRGSAPRASRAARPQTPEEPFPYESRPVSFAGADGTRRVGTLTLPAGPAPHPAVLLSSWHGRVDRNQTTRGHRPFAIWADRLTCLGLATLRYDKRGAGASDGDFDSATIADFAADLACAVACLRGEGLVDPTRIGLLGHSEGGHIGADVAAVDPAIAFCVMLTPSGVPETTTFETELFRAAEAVGGRPISREPSIALMLDLAAAAKTAPGGREAEARARAILTRAAAAGLLPAERVERLAAVTTTPWRRHFHNYDLTGSLRRLTCPVLIVFAGLDMQTAPRWHAPNIHAALAANPRATIVEFPGLNHFLQTAITGAPSEYGAIDQTLAPAAIAAVCDWIASTLRQ